MVTIKLSKAFRNCTNGEISVKLTEPNSAICDVLQNLIEKKCQALASYLFVDNSKRLSKFINFYVNGENIKHLQGDQTLIVDGDVIEIIPAIAGG